MYIGLDFVAGGKAPRIFLPNCGCGGGQTQMHGAPETLQIGIELQFHCKMELQLSQPNAPV